MTLALGVGMAAVVAGPRASVAVATPIAAAPSAVWAALADTSCYGAWNPTIARLDGAWGGSGRGS